MITTILVSSVFLRTRQTFPSLQLQSGSQRSAAARACCYDSNELHTVGSSSDTQLHRPNTMDDLRSHQKRPQQLIN